MAIQHLAFFEALAELPDESCPDWRTTSAGLLTLRFVDAWAYENESLVKSDSWSMRSLRRTISEMDARDPKRAILLSVVDTMRSVKTPGMAVIAPRLLAYARALQFDAKWSLAADVYSAVLRHVQAFEDPALVIHAYMQIGACKRVLAKWDEALAAYSLAADLARIAKNTEEMLRARVAEANVNADRGNLPKAEQILDEAIKTAGDAGLTEIRAIATQDRGHVAHLRGNYDLAIQLAYEALGSMGAQAARDRVLADLAATFAEVGLRSAARDANLILMATAQEQYTRWVATINLLELAALDRMEPVFEQYRRELASVELPAALAVYYHYYAGQGFRIFGQFTAAKASLQRAIAIASQHNLNEMLMRAEQSLHELDDGSVVRMKQVADPSQVVSEVAEAIREMRALVGVAG